MSFTVKQDAFEGPLDLLLTLIEKRKLFVNDISLAKVADDYIEHIKKFESFPLDQTAHFILVASTLLLIKSRSLLPTLTLTEEEEKGIEDLETRLKIYQKIKDVSLHVKNAFGSQPMFFPSKDRKAEVIFSPDASMTKDGLFEAIKRIIAQIPKKEILPKAIIKKVVSLEDMITTLTKRVSHSLRMSFSQFAGEHKHEKVNVIVSFLAMLELVKQGAIHVHQEANFSDIHMETKDVGVPRYF